MQEAALLKNLVGADHAAALLKLSERMPEEKRSGWLAQLLRMLTTQDKDISKSLKYRHKPVSVREFLESKFYLGKKGELYPRVVEYLEEINSGKYDEVVLTGGIGSAKTTIAIYSQAYQVYLLSCYRNPHALFALDSASEIKMVFQSLSARLAKGVDYNRFRVMMNGCPYFQNHFPMDNDVQSFIKFPNRIEIEPVAGTETAAIGQNVIGGIIDEVNFMQNIAESAKSPDGESYDQATQLYNTIARRRQSRFSSAAGGLPGLLCLVSSKKVPGQFTDKKEAEAKKNPRIYVYDKRVWDIKPEGFFSGRKFHVFVGDQGRQPRIIKEGEEVRDSDRHLIDAIPVEFRQAFDDDITKALRDVAGRSTLAIHPYLPRRDDVLANFGKRQNVFAIDCIDFSQQKMPIRLALTKTASDCIRWVHIDLGLTSDNAGIVIGHVPRFIKMDRSGYSEQLPVIEIDAVLNVIPPKSSGGEIDFAAIRRLLYKLRDLGMPLKFVTADTFQSADTIQVLSQQGFMTGVQSMDTSMLPYDLLKQALYDHRLVAPKHEKLVKELCSLERDFKKGKVDHPQHGSKDIADALAGVVYGLTTRREVWHHHQVPITQAISVASIIRDREHEKGEQEDPNAGRVRVEQGGWSGR